MNARWRPAQAVAIPGQTVTGVPVLVSPAYDCGWFVAPGVLSLLVGVTLGVLAPQEDDRLDIVVFVVAILMIDVAHVYATAFRTYFDRSARLRHHPQLWLVPTACAWFGFLVHLESPLAFWSLLAYVAMFHFVKQHVGFVLLYARAGRETPFDRRLAAASVWAGTAGPLVWWHAHLPRNFAWFLQGDMLTGLPSWVGTVALAAAAGVLLVFVVRRVWLIRVPMRSNPLLVILTVLPAANWTLGIVVFDDDRVFTITNVVFHGVPYMALVWRTGGQALTRSWLDRIWCQRSPAIVGGASIATFYAVVLAFAFIEERGWDRLVWHDHPWIFGVAPWSERHPVVTSSIVALLTVPQATHYVLDRFIWRVGRKNPQLVDQLRLGDAARAATPGLHR